MKEKLYWGKAAASFLLVLLMMPLGHALMILMEHILSPAALHPAAFARARRDWRLWWQAYS